MPELAEVDYYRKQWDPGLRQPILRVALHAEKRIFRGADTATLLKSLPGKKLLASESRGKQMLFRFSGSIWLGLHLGMTGKLTVANPDYAPQKHDHLVLFQKKRALVFTDMRQFGRVRFHLGKQNPDWWPEAALAVASPEFTLTLMTSFIQRHHRLPIKGILLKQDKFPGVGNWMADEILWRAKIHPAKTGDALTKPELRRLHRQSQYVCEQALHHIGRDFSDPPKNWFYHQRWSKSGRCPRHKSPLEFATIATRTTAWCLHCQPPSPR